MKDINVQAINKVNIIGKLMDMTLGSGTLSDTWVGRRSRRCARRRGIR